MSALRFGFRLMNSTKRPSFDQSVAVIESPAASSGSSLPPLSDFTYRSCVPFRLELNTRRLPSGDQTGKMSSAGSNMNRLNAPRLESRIQMSGLASPPR